MYDRLHDGSPENIGINSPIPGPSRLRAFRSSWSTPDPEFPVDDHHDEQWLIQVWPADSSSSKQNLADKRRPGPGVPLSSGALFPSGDLGETDLLEHGAAHSALRDRPAVAEHD